MNRLFDSSSPVMKAMSKIFDMGWLSILYLIFCIPVITIGPATTALYYTSIKVLRRERGYVWTEFFGCFKTNFKLGVIFGLLFMLVYLLLGLNIYNVATNGDGFGGYLLGAYVGFAVINTFVSCYVYPILSRFELSFIKLLKLALHMAFRHILFTIVLFGIVLIGLIGAYVSFVYTFPMILLVLPGGLSILYTFPMEYLLKKYTPKPEPIRLDNGEEVTPWYAE